MSDKVLPLSFRAMLMLLVPCIGLVQQGIVPNSGTPLARKYSVLAVRPANFIGFARLGSSPAGQVSADSSFLFPWLVTIWQALS